MTVEHARKLKSGFGGQIIMKYLDDSCERGDKSSCITLNIVQPLFPKKLEFANNRSIAMASQKSVGFVRVSRYWEQMTMNLRALITLAGQAKFGNRKVQVPRVKHSQFGIGDGYPLGTYFNMTHFNHVLTLGDYATLVGEKDYEAECSLADASHVAIYFLYEGDEEKTKQMLQLNKKQYDNISKKAGKDGWTKCPTLRKYIKENLKTKCFCVNVSNFTEWDRLENEVIKGAKCLTLSNWRGIGRSFRTRFSKKHLKFHAKDIQFALKPSGAILKEANRFRRVLYGPYIAVHIRAEKVFSAHGLSRLVDCVRVLAELVKVLKIASDITQVLIASDTSSFGSYAWEGQQKHRTLKNLHSFLVSSIGGIEYKPTADDVDRGVVALVEMTLLARATHLITVGKGSFQEWIVAKFLEQHREYDQPQWSLITMCSAD
ncbi:Hypothetical predicted protein [Paramuricea clavata]|uniref:Uncharacterized protein n=1 Tax=Paramuricea clavata TaxID=317549 RepID=A0A6S7G000_PARCT|nr:Hypothetical predicted protein [Paramuricea clavata]